MQVTAADADDSESLTADSAPPETAPTAKRGKSAAGKGRRAADGPAAAGRAGGGFKSLFGCLAAPRVSQAV
jgi:hypothetical protein